MSSNERNQQHPAIQEADMTRGPLEKLLRFLRKNPRTRRRVLRTLATGALGMSGVQLGKKIAESYPYVGIFVAATAFSGSIASYVLSEQLDPCIIPRLQREWNKRYKQDDDAEQAAGHLTSQLGEEYYSDSEFEVQNDTGRNFSKDSSKVVQTSSADEYFLERSLDQRPSSSKKTQ